jgi:hypothetical protein
LLVLAWPVEGLDFQAVAPTFGDGPCAKHRSQALERCRSRPRRLLKIPYGQGFAQHGAACRAVRCHQCLSACRYDGPWPCPPSAYQESGSGGNPLACPGVSFAHCSLLPDMNPALPHLDASCASGPAAGVSAAVVGLGRSTMQRHAARTRAQRHTTIPRPPEAGRHHLPKPQQPLTGRLRARSSLPR